MEITVSGYLCIVDDDFVFPKGKLSIRLGWNDTPYLHIGSNAAHRFIMDAPKGVLVDHINHNTLDNRKINLRLCNRSQNMWNRKRSCGVSKFKGVHWCNERQKWRTQIYLNNKRVHSRRFKCEKQAALFYNEKALELFGEFAHLNLIGDLS